MDDKLKKNMNGIFAEENILQDISEQTIVTTDILRYNKIILTAYGFTKDQIMSYLDDMVSAMQKLDIIED